ncbi:MAG: VOC family protein [Rhizobiaceae bacterium]|nr:VOC family protein [Rhizobiaceae bacterium]
MNIKSTKPAFARDIVRPIDHVVLSVRDLVQARERYNALGFKVAPVAQHNFGTQNAIVPFANGTFLEPLAIGESELVEKNILKGNPFLIRDRAFRFRHGCDDFAGGLSMVALAGTNAKADRKKFRKAGLRTGKMATVKRPGLKIRASFALDDRAADCTFFACERKDGPPVFDPGLTNHANGALRIDGVTLVEENPIDFAGYLKTVTGLDTFSENEDGLEFQLGNGGLSVLTPEGLKSGYGIELPATRCREGLMAVTFDIAVSSLDKTAMLLAQRGIEARQVGERIVVANAPGQGAMLAFVESAVTAGDNS